MRFIFAILLLTSCASARPVTHGIPQFHEVEHGIYRGGEPTTEGMRYLKSIGVKAIVKLNPDEFERESNDASDLGMSIRYVPLKSWLLPKTKDIDLIEEYLNDKSLRPIFFHCKHGEDRTGMVVGLYRVETDHWSPDHAHQEMKALGFHPILWGLNHYFWERTEN